ncbi:MAG: DUF3429 domain-containing protein [Burkholderiales bacterium]|nr:MAG: DUF3429 domain-containing protein [Burkholderiales bacterium]
MNRDPLDDPKDRALAHTLGYAGLIPFALLAVLLWLVEADLRGWVSMALAGYGALIASFLGGIHWGLAWLAGRQEGASCGPHAQRMHLLWGVLPSLLAWPGLLMPAPAGLAWLGFLLLLCYAVDRKLYRRAGLTGWLTLRFRLSAVAALSCFIGAAAI